VRRLESLGASRCSWQHHTIPYIPYRASCHLPCIMSPTVHHATHTLHRSVHHATHMPHTRCIKSRLIISSDIQSFAPSHDRQSYAPWYDKQSFAHRPSGTRAFLCDLASLQCHVQFEFFLAPLIAFAWRVHAKGHMPYVYMRRGICHFGACLLGACHFGACLYVFSCFSQVPCHFMLWQCYTKTHALWSGSC